MKSVVKSHRKRMPIAWAVALGCALVCSASGVASELSVVVDSGAGALERLAAKEIRRYLYLRSGVLATLSKGDVPPDTGDAIVLGAGDSVLLRAAGVVAGTGEALPPEGYRIQSVKAGKRKILGIAGGSPVGVLYGVYRYVEELGIRFYLHGDTIPDGIVAVPFPDKPISGEPLFKTRGIVPFHDFAEGPDWWSEDDYLAVIGQLAKMRMNFIGLHTYTSDMMWEPNVWIGLKEDVGEDGAVAAAPVSHYQSNMRTYSWDRKDPKTGKADRGQWVKFHKVKTSEYLLGANQCFPGDVFAGDAIGDLAPWPENPRDCRRQYDRVGSLFRRAFSYARHLNVKTGLGLQPPLAVDGDLRRKLKEKGIEKVDEEALKLLYEGMFYRIKKTHPLDYFWFWTSENWMHHGTSNRERVETEFRAAQRALEATGNPFALASAGWILGPKEDRTAFDAILPKAWPMSTLNEQLGRSPVEPGFARVHDRSKWAIPWLEDDQAMTIPQLWAGRMRQDAADARRYGCDGLLGIHWRTRVIGPNLAALATAAWTQDGWAQAKVPAVSEPRDEVLGGKVPGKSTQPIADTELDDIFQTVRYDVRGYRLRIPNGTYTVRLLFCESAYARNGARVFGVKIQDKLVLDALDIHAAVGKDRALIKAFEGVAVDNEILSIDFKYITEHPCIAGIEIAGTTANFNQFEGKPYRRAINCGGPKHGDFEADLKPVSEESVKNASRYAASGDFWGDWCRNQFGDAVAEDCARIFAAIDDALPRPANWTSGPGGFERRRVSKDYDFVDRMAALRAKVVGPTHLEQFDYWLENFRYLRAFDDCNEHRDIEHAVVAMRHLMNTLGSHGELGNINSWHQLLLPQIGIRPGQVEAKLRAYDGPLRVIVPSVRGSLCTGEDLSLKVWILAKQHPVEALLHWRALGEKEFQKVPVTRENRGVYRARIPTAQLRDRDFEYYIEARDGDARAVFPASAPGRCHALVILDGFALPLPIKDAVP